MKVARYLENIQAYQPAVPLENLASQIGLTIDQIIKADANENPYGATPKAAEALTHHLSPHLYPDPAAVNLREKLSLVTGAPADQIMIGNGADELIDLIMRLFLDPGDVLIDLPPTFAMYKLHAELTRAVVLEIPRHPDFSINLPALQEAAKRPECKLVFLTSPNNPDGSLIPQSVIKQLLDLPIMLVVDEAYMEFAGDQADFGISQSVIPWVSQVDNLILLRTFSKWAGLAGLRVGYGVFPAWLMPYLWKIKQPYNVNGAAQAAAAACLDDLPYYQTILRQIAMERDRLAADFSALPGLIVFPSQTNFLLCQLQQGSAKELAGALRQQGILVRAYDEPHCPQSLRISIMQPWQNDRIFQAVKALLSAGGDG
jgi:histidinol-phosphate aminotransferase